MNLHYNKKGLDIDGQGSACMYTFGELKKMKVFESLSNLDVPKVSTISLHIAFLMHLIQDQLARAGRLHQALDITEADGSCAQWLSHDEHAFWVDLGRKMSGLGTLAWRAIETSDFDCNRLRVV